MCAHASHKAERAPLVPWGYSQELGLGQTRCFVIINFTNFLRLWMGLYPIVRVTGLPGPAPPPEAPMSWRGGGGSSVSPRRAEQCCGPLGCEAAASWEANRLLLPGV